MGCINSKLSSIESVKKNPNIEEQLLNPPITTVEKIFSFIPDETKPNILDDIDIINKKIFEEIKKKDSIIDLNIKITISQDEIQNLIKDIFEVIPNNVCIYYNSIIMCYLVKKLENNIIEFSIEENYEINYREIISIFLIDIILNYYSKQNNNNRIFDKYELNIKVPIKYYIGGSKEGILSLTIKYNFIINNDEIIILINNKNYNYKLYKNDKDDNNAIFFEGRKYYFTSFFNTLYLIFKGELNIYEDKYRDRYYEYDTYGFYTGNIFIQLLEYYYKNGYILSNLYVKYDESIYIMKYVNGIIQLKSIFCNNISSDRNFTDIKIFNIIGKKLLDIQFITNAGLTLSNPIINMYVNEIKRYFLQLLIENNNFNMIFHVNDRFTNLLSSELQKYRISFDIEKIKKNNNYFHSFNFNLSNTEDLIERLNRRDSIVSIASIGSIESEVPLIENKQIELSIINNKKKD